MLLWLCTLLWGDANILSISTRQPWSERLKLYRWLESETPPQACVGTLFSGLTELQSSRRAIPFAAGRQVCDVLNGLSQNGVTYYLFDRYDGMAGDVMGRAMLRLPPGFEQRLESHPHVLRRFASPAGAVYELQFSPQDYVRAYRALQEAEATPEPGARQRALEASLAAFPGFPQARFQLARLHLEQGQGRALEELEEAVLANPGYPEWILMLASEVRARGDRERARRWAEQGLRVARALGDGASETQLKGFLGAP